MKPRNRNSEKRRIEKKVRARMAKTGESYMTALRAVLKLPVETEQEEHQPVEGIPVPPGFFDEKS